MSDINFFDKVSIINYGIGTQHQLADLNATVARTAREKDYSDISVLYENLLKLMSDDNKAPAYADTLVQAIKEALLKMRIELMKDTKLYAELLKVNEVYIEKLSDEIRIGQEHLTTAKKEKDKAYDPLSIPQLARRIDELKTSKQVALSLSDELRLYEKNSSSLAGKIQTITKDLLPLWEGSHTINTNKKSTEEALKIVESMVSEVEKELG